MAETPFCFCEIEQIIRHTIETTCPNAKSEDGIVTLQSRKRTSDEDNVSGNAAKKLLNITFGSPTTFIRHVRTVSLIYINYPLKSLLLLILNSAILFNICFVIIAIWENPNCRVRNTINRTCRKYVSEIFLSNVRIK